MFSCKGARGLMAAGALLLLGAAPAAAQAERLGVDLNIPALRVTVREGGRLLASYPVAVGQVGHATPTGRFTISHAEWNPSWRPPASEWARGSKVAPPGPNNPMGRVKLFFAPLYYLHGTPDEASVGTPASHGCVRMSNRDVVALATLVHDRADPTLPADRIAGVLARPRQTRTSRFRDSVTFVVRYETVEVVDGRLVVYPDLYQRGTTHPEAVYQALLAAGGDVRALPRSRVQEILGRARRERGAARIALAELGVAIRARAE